MPIAIKPLIVLSLLAAVACSQPVTDAPDQPTDQGQSTAEEPSTAQVFDQSVNVSQTEAMPDKIVTDFTQAGTESERWRNVDDTVMGGVSQGEMLITEQGIGVFQGTLSLENNGGFSSVRRNMGGYDFEGTTTISVRVKGDGRRYQLRLHPQDTDRVTYRAPFETVAGEWQIVTVPFADFEPVFRGRIVESAPPLNAEEINQMGFLIADKKNGDFKLEVDWIAVE